MAETAPTQPPRQPVASEATGATFPQAVEQARLALPEQLIEQVYPHESEESENADTHEQAAVAAIKEDEKAVSWRGRFRDAMQNAYLRAGMAVTGGVGRVTAMVTPRPQAEVYNPKANHTTRDRLLGIAAVGLAGFVAARYAPDIHIGGGHHETAASVANMPSGGAAGHHAQETMQSLPTPSPNATPHTHAGTIAGADHLPKPATSPSAPAHEAITPTTAHAHGGNAAHEAASHNAQLGHYSAKTGEGTVWNVARDQLHAHGVTHPTQSQIARETERILHLNNLSWQQASELADNAQIRV